MDKREQMKNDLKVAYRAAFGTVEGNKVLDDLMDKCGLYRRMYDDNPYSVYFHEGRRDVFLYIMDMLANN